MKKIIAIANYLRIKYSEDRDTIPAPAPDWDDSSYDKLYDSPNNDPDPHLGASFERHEGRVEQDQQENNSAPLSAGSSSASGAACSKAGWVLTAGFTPKELELIAWGLTDLKESYKKLPPQSGLANRERRDIETIDEILRKISDYKSDISSGVARLTFL